MIAPAGSEDWADRQPVAVPWDGTRRLWSLWETMQRFDAAKFLDISTRLAQLSQIMIVDKWVGFPQKEYDWLVSSVNTIHQQLTDMGLDAAEKSAERLLDIVSTKGSGLGERGHTRFSVADSNHI